MYLLKNADKNLVVETLPNKLKLAILRSDAVVLPIISVSVAVGHYHETHQCYGFSHLLEHMIFHRSENFNSSEALERHVSQHGGYINGWTHACHTNFHLSCAAEGFVSAVEMLCDKIAHPRFDLSDLETEIAAIDEEFKLKRKDPVRALFEVKKEIANPEHPFHRFTVGNAETLGALPLPQLKQELQAHHASFFHSGNIGVCIKLPKHTDFEHAIGQIKDILSTKIQTKAPNHQLHLPQLYTEQMRGKWIDVHSEQAHCQLILSYLIDKQDVVNDYAALKMIRHLIESKHKGGVFDALISKNWISNLSVSGGIEQFSHEEVQIHLALSHEGAKHKNDIISLLKDFLHFLADGNLANWRFTELTKQYSLIEKYAQSYDPVETCINIAQALHEDKLISVPSSNPIAMYDVKHRVSDILSQLKEQAHHIFFIGAHPKADNVTQYYKVKYTLSDIVALHYQHAFTFMLAPQNVYLSDQLLMVSQELPSDQIEIIEQHGVKLKFAQIIHHQQPCGDCFISINSPAMCSSLAQLVSKKVWVEAFASYLKRRFYQANDAGISYRVYGHQHGLSIHTTGFSDKQLMLCIEIVNCLIAFRLKQNEFDDVKHAIIRRLTNRLLQKPINQMFASLNTLIQGDTYSIHQQVKALENLQFEQLNQYQSEFLQEVCVETLLAGNWRRFAAQRMHQQLMSRLTHKKVWKKPSIVANSVDKPCLPLLPMLDESADTALVFYQQVNYLSPEFIYLDEHATAICLILEHVLGPHVFLRLRNDKKLGYLVGVGYKPINQQAGIVIYVQSSRASAADIYEGIQTVLNEMLNNWQETVIEIEQSKPKVIEQCEPMNRDISSIARRLWASFEHDDAFYSYRRLQEAVKDLDTDVIKQWLVKMSAANQGQVLLSNDTQLKQDPRCTAFTERPEVR